MNWARRNWNEVALAVKVVAFASLVIFAALWGYLTYQRQFHWDLLDLHIFRATRVDKKDADTAEVEEPTISSPSASGITTRKFAQQREAVNQAVREEKGVGESMGVVVYDSLVASTFPLLFSSSSSSSASSKGTHRWQSRSKGLLLYRGMCVVALVATWLKFVLYTAQSTNIPFPQSSFFTLWNFAILTVYFTLAFAYSVVVFWKGRPVASPFHSSWRRVMWVVFEQQLLGNVIVTVAFWTLTYPALSAATKKDMLKPAFVMMHLANFIFIIGELALNQLPVVWEHLGFALSVSVVYLFFGTLVYGTLPSLPLDLASASSGGVLVVLFAVHIACYLGFCSLTRRKLTRLHKQLHLCADLPCNCKTKQSTTDDSNQANINFPPKLSLRRLESTQYLSVLSRRVVSQTAVISSDESVKLLGLPPLRHDVARVQGSCCSEAMASFSPRLHTPFVEGRVE